MNLRNMIAYCGCLVGAVGIVTMVTIVPASSQERLSAAKFNEIFDATFSYASSALACGDQQTIQIGRDSLIRVLNYGDFNDLLNPRAQAVQDDINGWLERGKQEYLTRKWVGCDQVKVYVRQLDEFTRSISR